MEFEYNHESVCINEVVFDGNLEQPIELDHLLPDYCPSIFKVLKCRLIPKITSERVTDGKLYIDAVAMIKVLYVAEESNEIRTVDQKIVFSKTADIRKDIKQPIINTTAKCDYVNCRVVNPKRLDIRGAVSIYCSVTEQKCENIISDAAGGGIQMKKRSLLTGGVKKTASKQFTVREELEIGAGKPSIGTILSGDAVCPTGDIRLIANKVICKGEALLHTLYLPEGENAKPELMENSILLSQIIDLPGVDEDFTCNVVLKTGDVLVDVKEDSGGENRILAIEITVIAECIADKNREIQTVSDMFSTCYDAEITAEIVKLESILATVNETTVCKQILDFPGDQVDCIYDVKCHFDVLNTVCEAGKIKLSGNLNIEILAVDQEQIPCVLERSVPCEYELELPSATENTLFRYDARIVSVGYSIGGDKIELRLEFKTNGCLYALHNCEMITDISLNTDSPKTRNDDAALKLYFADEGESIWDIAKRYNTSVRSILEDNSLEGKQIEKRGMILIPIID